MDQAEVFKRNRRWKIVVCICATVMVVSVLGYAIVSLRQLHESVELEVGGSIHGNGQIVEPLPQPAVPVSFQGVYSGGAGDKSPVSPERPESIAEEQDGGSLNGEDGGEDTAQ